MRLIVPILGKFMQFQGKLGMATVCLWYGIVEFGPYNMGPVTNV